MMHYVLTIFIAFSGVLSPLCAVAQINQQRLGILLNLSRTTVSRSLANHPMIHPDTRAKVLALAEKLGYRKSRSRLVSRRRETKPLTIGVLVGMPSTNLGMATFPYVLHGIREQSLIDHVAIDVITQDPAELNPTKEGATVEPPIFSLLESDQAALGRLHSGNGCHGSKVTRAQTVGDRDVYLVETG